MSEHLVRTSRAPAIVIVVEREGPTRVFSTASTDAEEAALAAWIDASPFRLILIDAALRDRATTGGATRGRRWARVLQRENPGVVGVVERLIAGG